MKRDPDSILVEPDRNRSVDNLLDAEFIHNPPGPGRYCHAPTLVALPEGGLLAAWYAYPEEEYRGGVITLARREAGERTWRASAVLRAEQQHSAGNPVLFQTPQGETGLLYVVLKGNYWNKAELQGCFSSDAGRSWSPAQVLWPNLGLMVRHPPVSVGNGALLLPAYDEDARESLLLTAQPPYRQWKETYRFTGLPLIQPVLVRRGEDLLIFFRPADDPRRIWRSCSHNDGRSWSTPVRTALPNPLSGIGAFLAGMDIALVYNHTEQHQRHPLSITRSKDGGLSWMPPWHIDATANEVSYPSFINGSGGLVHGVYTYNRRMVKYVEFSAGQMA